MRLETERMFLYPVSNEAMEKMIEEEQDGEMRQAYREMLDGCLREPENRIWYAVWMMELKEQPGVSVGDLCFKGINGDGMVEIGYGLYKGFCGRGYMREAVSMISQWALAQKGVMRVEAETDPQNIASQRVLAASGYMPTGECGKEGPRFVFVRGQ